jgi:2-C-methyl-D-erythritol 4-phosphate cytidylyltransferase
MTSAIIVAAGASRRMGFDKLSANLCGKPVLRWSIEAFDACDAVDEIVIVAGDAVRDLVQPWISANAFQKPFKLCAGGSERHFSVSEGLKGISSSSDIVAVHDGARPLITPEQIQLCIKRAREVKAVACARPVTETLKRADARGVITGSIERDGAWIMETPQVFDRQLLCDAYERVLRDGLTVTDEVSAVQHLGAEVFVVENTSPNLKITHPAELALAEKIIAQRTA